MRDTHPVWAVIPAAGIGKRMGAQLAKQYLELAGQTILECTLDRIASCTSVDAMVVGISNSDTLWPKLNYQHDKLKATTPGGKERAHTVQHALKYIINQGGEDNWVLVHDAVRPCVRTSEIEKLISSVLEHANTDSSGGLLAVPVSDTMKRANNHASDGACVASTVPRENLWRAMTPQLFRVSTLKTALDASITAGYDATDESAAIERLGYQPELVACQADNIKITTPDDLALAQLIIQTQ